MTTREITQSFEPQQKQQDGSCALCSHELPRNPIIDGENHFCCPGCHAVFNILSSKNQLGNFHNHPVFKQAIRSGLISNPALLEQIRRNNPQEPDSELEKLHLEVGDMWCPSCAEVIRLILLQEKGVRNCVVDYATDLASVEFSPRHISKEKIIGAINSLGYAASPLQSGDKKAVSFDLYLRFIVAAFFSLNVMMFAYPLYASYFNYDEMGFGGVFAWLSFYASLPVLGYSAWPVFRRFYAAMRVGLFGMEALVVMGVAAAFGLSVYELFTGGNRVYFDSMTVIIVFVLLGKIIEAKAKFSAKDSLLRLTKAMPRRGRKRFSDGSQRFVPMKEIVPGDVLIALTGEKIVQDGIVVEGEGACDESLMTGESVPVDKKVGGTVLAGAFLQHGWIAFKVTKTVEESVLHKIIEMVEHDIGHKTVYIRAADSIVSWFVPIVLAIALGAAASVFMFGDPDPGKSAMQTAILRAVSVLLISCPCAIGIAAPLAESHLMNGLAKMGAIVRNRGCLSVLGSESVFVFDKTGTVTEGRFKILNGMDDLTTELQTALKGLASQSNHVIASSISQSLDCEAASLRRIEEFSGKGLRGYLEDDLYHLGSGEFLRQQGIETAHLDHSDATRAITTTVYFAKNGRCLAAINLGDRVREGSEKAISSLKPAKAILLSGDSEGAVKAVAEACGFESWKSGFSPLQKREFIDLLRHDGEIVCMLGDGINDAPALTGAHIGISVVSATDISIQVSDILLTTDRLCVIPRIRSLAQKGRKIVKQNLFWAFFYNVIGIGLAAFGLLSPIFAAFAMVASSLFVLFNAKRIG